MTVLRALNRAEQEAFTLIRLVAVEWMPYFGRAMFAVRPVAAPGLGTFAVDGHWRLYLEPDLLVGPDAWPRRQAAAVFIHEIEHLVRAHAARATEVQPQPLHRTAWNYATDAEINDGLLEIGVPLPDGAITPETLSEIAPGTELADGGLAEDYYAAINPGAAPFSPWAGEPFGDEAGCGSGSGSDAHQWELPADIADTAAQGLDAAAADLIRRLVARDVRDAMISGRGTVPGGLARWSEQTLTPPQVPWWSLIRPVLRQAIANQAGRTHCTYSRPSRRRVPGVILPAWRSSDVRFAMVLDTSGSMTEDALAAGLSEIEGVLRTSGIDRDHVYVLACDAASAEPQLVRSAREVTLVGGGGTDMRVGIAAAEALRPAPHVVAVLTDGDTPWPEAPGRAVLIPVIIGNPRAVTPAWAHTVHIPADAGSTPAVRR